MYESPTVFVFVGSKKGSGLSVAIMLSIWWFQLVPEEINLGM